MGRIALRAGVRVISCRAVLTGKMAGFAEIKSGIGEVVVGAAGNAGLILIEVERVAARTYSRTLVHTDAGGGAINLR